MAGKQKKTITLHNKKIRQIAADPVASAAAFDLVYVNDRQEGIARLRKGKNFRYFFKNKIVRDKSQLDRIRSLVLPPAWEKVWICRLANGHLQATGLDTRGRKQYRYHPKWNSLRNQTKFYRMLEFGNTLPLIRGQVKKDISKSGIPREKVLATVIELLELTCIRVGNESYEKMYGSIGLTTMKDKHVEIKRDAVKFSFIGKKGKEHEIKINSKKLAAIVKKCRDIPGKELFQYIDETGQKQSVDSGMVNEYIQSLSGKDFTTKDFRTWAGTLQSLIEFGEAGPSDKKSESKKNVVDVLDRVAAHLGNTRTVCRKYYVHPSIIEMYENNQLQRYIGKKMMGTIRNNKPGLIPAEKILLRILKKLNGTSKIKLNNGHA